MYFIHQIQKDDCGFACLKMILATINKDKNYLYLPQDESHGPYSLEELGEIGQNYGLSFEAFRATIKTDVANCPRFPFIAILSLKNEAKHAVCVTRVKWGRVSYVDPRYGKVSVPLKKFVNDWDGTGLLIKGFEKRKCPIKSPNPISFGQRLLLGMIQFIAGSLAVLGVYFIKDGTPIYLPMIFLSLAIAGEVIMKVLSYAYMKKIDDYFFNENRIPRSGFRNYFLRFENYKRLSLYSPMNYVLIFVFTLGLVAVVLFNDYRNLLIVLAPVTLAFLEALIITPILKKKKQFVSELEDNIDNSKNVKDFKEKIRAMHKQAYSYSYLNLLTTYLFALLILVSVILTMKLCEITSFPYIIFYTCIAIALFKAMRELFSTNERINEFNIVKVKISNSMKSHE